MTEHVCECKEYAIACEGEWEETVVCKDCGMPVTSQEIIRSLHATNRLSAEGAEQAAQWILDTPSGNQAKKDLRAYADILEAANE